MEDSQHGKCKISGYVRLVYCKISINVELFAIIFFFIFIYLFLQFLGDITEDPSHPKSLWPSDISCPECRPHPWNIVSSQLNMMQTVDGVLWNLEATSNYLMNLYANDKIVGTTMTRQNAHNVETILNDSPQPSTQIISQDVISRLQGNLKYISEYFLNFSCIGYFKFSNWINKSI